MTEIWAHRGASAYAPENTLAAFRLAEEQGADGIELDVQLSADGDVIVMHDETVDRTTNGSGAVAELTTAELQKLDASLGRAAYAGEPVPLLEQVFEAVRPGRMIVNVELKTGLVEYPGIAQKVADLVDVAGLRDRVWISSFNHWTLQESLDADPALPTGVLFVEQLIHPGLYAASTGAEAIHPHHSLLRHPAALDDCRQRGIRVHTWTLNDEPVIQAALDAEVDALITNHPDLALRLRGQ